MLSPTQTDFLWENNLPQTKRKIYCPSVHATLTVPLAHGDKAKPREPVFSPFSVPIHQTKDSIVLPPLLCKSRAGFICKRDTQMHMRALSAFYQCHAFGGGGKDCNAELYCSH